ncbi:MAG: hypothetical protein LUD00_01155 [Prevotellaceae bacterium]|nr:hypothetical protein [Prevotellaceae bacterium]
MGVSAIHPLHGLFRDRYIGSSPKLGEVARSDGGVCRIRLQIYTSHA